MTIPDGLDPIETRTPLPNEWVLVENEIRKASAAWPPCLIVLPSKGWEIAYDMTVNRYVVRKT